MYLFRILIALVMSLPFQGLAQSMAYYTVEFRTASLRVMSLPEVWKISEDKENNTTSLDKGDDDTEIHEDWKIVSTYDTESSLVERFIIHPKDAVRLGVKSFTSYVERQTPEGKILETWPAVHSIVTVSEVSRLVSTHFRNDGSRIVWKRVFGGSGYFLPIFLIKETYEHSWATEPTEITIYRRAHIQ